MSKKKTATKKTTTKKAKQTASDTSTAESQEGATPEATDGAEAAAGSASRLPAVGTVIKKTDRHGAVRCQCTVVEEGVRYKGRVFGSLSGAAMAAAQDLGLKNKTQNVW
jgi:hypothetical protein